MSTCHGVGACSALGAAMALALQLGAPAALATESKVESGPVVELRHRYEGDDWADRFLTTPKDGLDDRYLGAEGKLGKAAWVTSWHDFRADHGGRHYGSEFDASLGYPLCAHLTGLLKLADYHGDGFGTSERKLWVSLEYRY